MTERAGPAETKAENHMSAKCHRLAADLHKGSIASLSTPFWCTCMHTRAQPHLHQLRRPTLWHRQKRRWLVRVIIWFLLWEDVWAEGRNRMIEKMESGESGRWASWASVRSCFMEKGRAFLLDFILHKPIQPGHFCLRRRVKLSSFNRHEKCISKKNINKPTKGVLWSRSKNWKWSHF